MKKGIFAILAVLTVLAMVMMGCPGSDPDPDPEEFTVTFDLNGGTGTKPADQKVEEGKSVTLPSGTGLTGPSDKPNFVGWNTSASATTALTSFTPTANATLYAIWSAGSGPGPGPGPGGDGFTVSFDLNGGEGDAVQAITQANGEDPVELPRANAEKGTQIFNGWAKDAAGAEMITTASITDLTADITLYATYIDNPAGAEKLELTNGFYAIYRFDMPDGTTWEDYKTLTVDYLFTAYDLANARARNARIMGPYKETDFTLETGTAGGTAPGKHLAIASYNANKNAEYILDNGLLANNSDPGALITELKTKASITAVGGEWFTYDKYVIDGSTKNSGYVDANLPAADFNGVLYFGIGLCAGGANDPANIHYVKNVKLVSYAGDRDILGTPLLFVDTAPSSATEGVLFPAFSGYPTVDGSNGYAATNRVMADGSQSFAIPTTTNVELVALANAWYAVYKFEIPNSKKWEDYKTITVDYLFTAEHLATAFSRNGRVMGPYKESDFTFWTGTNTGSAPGKKMAIANYNADKNTPYILDGGLLANSGQGTLITELKNKASIDAVGGEWFTYDKYVIDGSTKNSGYVDANLPAADFNGVLYFGIGLPSAGASDPANVQYIKNVTLKGYDPADDIIATPAYFTNSSASADTFSYPAFAGYPTVDGSNGFAAAYRLKGTR